VSDIEGCYAKSVHVVRFCFGIVGYIRLFQTATIQQFISVITAKRRRYNVENLREVREAGIPYRRAEMPGQSQSL